MSNQKVERRKLDRIAQWAFDTRPILGRLHLALRDVEIELLRGNGEEDEFSSQISFMDGRMERLMCMTAAVTALGTQLYGRYGEGHGLDKPGLNQVKKDADAISAYAMSESLWFAARQLPENHAIMVCLGEGLMPKAGETPEMGSNPQLGFGRIYARPQIAQWLDQRVARLLNDQEYHFDDFYLEIKETGITVWGAAIDTLENTSRFAKGATTGPMTVLHLFDQPLRIALPYEGYMGNLILPKKVVQKAAHDSILLDFRTPRKLVMQAIEKTYPGIKRQNVHVWTLGGTSRTKRIGRLWNDWKEVGAHVVDEDWILPTGIKAFTESGTYAPVHSIGSWIDEQNETHLFLCDGYAASAEAMQAASLSSMYDLDASIVIFTSKFKLPYDREQNIMRLDPNDPELQDRLSVHLGATPDNKTLELYRDMINEALLAELPLQKRVLRVDDFFPEKNWGAVALSGFMCPDPYTGCPGVEKVEDNVYRTSVRITTKEGEKNITFTLQLLEKPAEGRLIFNPLLIRFIYGEDFRARPVKISDSGRIRNELQTLCSEALDFSEQQKIKIHFDRIPHEVISRDKQKLLAEVLKWYKDQHPIWFNWLEITNNV